MDKPKQVFGLQEIIEACYKKWPDILDLHVQKQQPEVVSATLECLWNLRSIILLNEQFVSYYGIRHIIACDKIIGQIKQCMHRFKCILLRTGIFIALAIVHVQHF